MGRRGPGSGLRQAATVAEAAQWMRLFDALASPHAEPLLTHLALRAGDAAALGEVGPLAAESLRQILAETQDPAALDAVNGVLTAAYAALEAREGARLARSVFALASDGFPGDDDLRLMERWEESLRCLLDDFAASGLPESKRDVVVAMVGHHVAVMDALHLDATARAVDRVDAQRLHWLLALLRWRRFGSMSRALARVLNIAERDRLAAFTRLAAQRSR